MIRAFTPLLQPVSKRHVGKHLVFFIVLRVKHVGTKNRNLYFFSSFPRFKCMAVCQFSKDENVFPSSLLHRITFNEMHISAKASQYSNAIKYYSTIFKSEKQFLIAPLFYGSVTMKLFFFFK